MKLFIRGAITLLDALVVIAAADPADLGQAHVFGFAGTAEDMAVYLRAINGPSWTICHAASGAQVAIGGFERIRSGVYRSWFIAKQTAFELYGREITAICARSIRTLLEDGAHRVETVSLLNRDYAHRWYEAIGLTRESESPGYGINGETAVTYVRLR